VGKPTVRRARWLFGWFDATLDVEMADALDIPATFSSTVPIRIPTHPKG
jgi:hypothetical protein